MIIKDKQDDLYDDLYDDIDFLIKAVELNMDVEELVRMCREKSKELEITAEEYLSKL